MNRKGTNDEGLLYGACGERRWRATTQNTVSRWHELAYVGRVCDATLETAPYGWPVASATTASQRDRLLRVDSASTRGPIR